jgi:UDP-glucose 4-epimerase
MSKKYAVIGGAGFIGSHFVSKLLGMGHSVVVVDNFCSGSLSRLEKNLKDSRLRIYEINVEDTSKLIDSIKGINSVIHLASNPDISKSMADPRIDFLQGTVLTESVVEACRINNVQTILYASGSGVYGDAGQTILTENSLTKPISTYGASKLAGESLLASYSFMFGMKCIAFRFANVVGPKQTHGVGYDFLNRLINNYAELEIMGDGLQSKSYIYVDDVVDAVLLAEEKILNGFDIFNVSTSDQINVNQIALIVENILGLNPKNIKHKYTGGDRGWKADVPVVKLSADKISKLGWRPEN